MVWYFCCSSLVCLCPLMIVLNGRTVNHHIKDNSEKTSRADYSINKNHYSTNSQFICNIFPYENSSSWPVCFRGPTKLLLKLCGSELCARTVGKSQARFICSGIESIVYEIAKRGGVPLHSSRLRACRLMGLFTNYLIVTTDEFFLPLVYCRSRQSLVQLV